ncbi:MAG: chemoreceptor glutamine deamidase CheD [Nitrospira sp. LK70]|nr:chemoreceptor glutamine deamidase CheD [Nitrospira sp. LK70]
MGESRVQIVGPDDLSEGTLTSMALIQTDHFAHIRRMRDSRFPHEIAAILPGEFFVSPDPMIVYTVLGSCVSACVRDPVAGVGGMNHFMLPKPTEERSDSWGASTRYGSYAMESLINEIIKRGGSKSRLEIKLFGAGRICDGNLDVGARNAEWVLDYLQAEGLTACRTDLGDIFARKIYYFTESGRVLMKKIERVKNHTIAERENEYATRIQLKEQVPVEDVTLF